MALERSHGERYHFEFKVLWPNGVKECVDGLAKDGGKLEGIPQGYLVAFAYALSKAPGEHGTRTMKRDLEVATKAAVDRLGTPFFESGFIEVNGHGTEGRAQLQAWKVGGAPAT